MGTVHLSEKARVELLEYLSGLGYEIAQVPCNKRRGRGVGDHADLVMCKMGAGGRAPVLKADDGEALGEYPQNAAYCAVALGKRLIHRLDITAPKILEFAELENYELINVRQGYTRCSCIPVDDDSLITADCGIAAALEGKADVLRISPGHVLLDGFEYGFLGGASGRVGDEIVFNGDMTAHPDFKRIEAFIEDRGLRIRQFDWPLRDIGSIISED